jgi:hypothetical protein
MRKLASMGIAALLLQGCAPLATHEGRAAQSTLGCMRQSIANYDFKSRPDSEAHCLAAGLIARRCSVAEARLASYGKEFADLFDSGDAEWRDLRADRRGIECARSATTEAALLGCCTK